MKLPRNNATSREKKSRLRWNFFFNLQRVAYIFSILVFSFTKTKPRYDLLFHSHKKHKLRLSRIGMIISVYNIPRKLSRDATYRLIWRLLWRNFATFTVSPKFNFFPPSPPSRTTRARVLFISLIQTGDFQRKYNTVSKSFGIISRITRNNWNVTRLRQRNATPKVSIGI